MLVVPTFAVQLSMNIGREIEGGCVKEIKERQWVPRDKESS